ncbi:MAG TPA: DUF1634 domain-containing protein [Thermoplasmata archaeon]|nr:DUF1634 domain-containing protein [Thermoplasmata archaeon]
MTASSAQGTTGSVPLRPLPVEAYRRMSVVLRTGLLVSLVILLAGLIAYLVEHGLEPFGTAVSTNPILNYLSLDGLASGLAHGAVEAYLTLGLLVLVATPILRVASGWYYFQRGRERSMAGITLTVLVLLLVGILVLGPLVR